MGLKEAFMATATTPSFPPLQPLPCDADSWPAVNLMHACVPLNLNLNLPLQLHALACFAALYATKKETNGPA